MRNIEANDRPVASSTRCQAGASGRVTAHRKKTPTSGREMCLISENESEPRSLSNLIADESSSRKCSSAGVSLRRSRNDSRYSSCTYDTKANRTERTIAALQQRKVIGLTSLLCGQGSAGAAASGK